VTVAGGAASLAGRRLKLAAAPERDGGDRVQAPVGDADRAGGERGPDDLVELLRLAGEVQEELGARRQLDQRRVAGEVADAASHGRAEHPAVARVDHLAPGSPQPLRHPVRERGLPAPVDPLERHEHGQAPRERRPAALVNAWANLL